MATIEAEAKESKSRDEAREELRKKVKELSQNKIAAICSEVGLGSCFW
ncbi:MAG: hypothetical protein WCC94_04150 [Candidatus Bathyarchaeia archaeon]